MSLPHSLSSEEFFIVRHGESKSNEAGLVGGQLVDWPLSENGRLQVEGAGFRIAGDFPWTVQL